MIWFNNDLKLSHRKQVNTTPNINLATYLMNFECKPCGIFKCFKYHQEDESIDTTTLSTTTGLGYRIKNLVSSNFMFIVISVLVIFDTRATYSCSSNNGDCVELEDNILFRNIKAITKSLDISGSRVVKYSVRSESGCMIAFQSQEYYVPGLPKDLCIILPQVICK